MAFLLDQGQSIVDIHGETRTYIYGIVDEPIKTFRVLSDGTEEAGFYYCVKEYLNEAAKDANAIPLTPTREYYIYESDTNDWNTYCSETAKKANGKSAWKLAYEHFLAQAENSIYVGDE